VEIELVLEKAVSGQISGEETTFEDLGGERRIILT
jgi:hypothetical protein